MEGESNKSRFYYKLTPTTKKWVTKVNTRQSFTLALPPKHEFCRKKFSLHKPRAELYSNLLQILQKFREEFYFNPPPFSKSQLILIFFALA